MITLVFIGLMQAIQNLGLALITMVSGIVVDKLGYLWLECFFILWLIVALVCTTVIWLMDSAGDGYLNMNVEERDAFDERRRREAEEAARREEIQREIHRPRTANELRNR